MRVAMYYNNRDVRLEEMAVPRIGAGELLVRIRASGICGSDLMEWYRIKKAPLVLGHEIAVKVVSTPTGDRRAKPEFEDVRRVAEATGRPAQTSGETASIMKNSSSLSTSRNWRDSSPWMGRSREVGRRATFFSSRILKIDSPISSANSSSVGSRPSSSIMREETRRIFPILSTR